MIMINDSIKTVFETVMVGSNNSHCQIFEFVSRAKC